MSTTLVSAPGKVLLAGGFLVLDPKYFGIVISTSARFYTLVRPTKRTSSSTADNSNSNSFKIRVTAAQFPKEPTWQYTAHLGNGGLKLEASDEASRGNKFVQLPIDCALRYAHEVVGDEGVRKGLGGGVDIVVLADNDFYSQSDKTNTTLSPFSPLPNPIASTNKTGLGSSASLVTSLSASLLSHLGVVTLPTPAEADQLHSSDSSSTPKDLGVIHSVAQYAHCLAQGKVGSGFDISSSVYGTHIYKRFSPNLLDPLMSSTPTASLVDTLNPDKWDQSITPFRLPKGLRLVLADVNAGTNTPSFIKGILKWREEKPEESLAIWTKLYEANTRLVKALEALRDMEGHELYQAVLERAAGLPIEQAGFSAGWSAHPEKTVPIATGILAIRQALKIRAMSKASQVPVEPQEQTNLLEESIQCPGVIGGTVPGAGGYDAIVLLIVDDPRVIHGVEKVWQGWTEMQVKPLSTTNSDGGLRREQVGDVKGLEEVLSGL